MICNCYLSSSFCLSCFSLDTGFAFSFLLASMTFYFFEEIFSQNKVYQSPLHQHIRWIKELGLVFLEEFFCFFNDFFCFVHFLSFVYDAKERKRTKRSLFTNQGFISSSLWNRDAILHVSPQLNGKRRQENTFIQKEF